MARSALQLVLALSFCHVALAQHTGTFTQTGNMTTPRIGHTATLLLNGKVLITGGSDPTHPGSALASTELFNPDTGTFTATGNMITGRSSHSSTLLPDGRVLIAGGTSSDFSDRLATAEIYNPDTGTFSSTGSMVTAQAGHTATLLNNGKVLITGGGTLAVSCPDFNVANPEIFDPATGMFSATGGYAANGDPCFGTTLASATATLLPNGKVLIGSGSLELYDPATDTFSLTGRNATRGSIGRTATLLPNGKVLVTGGEDDFGDYANTELYDPSAGEFTASGNMTRPRMDHTATLLRDGSVLIAGGQLSPGVVASTELYDSATGSFTAPADMTFGRFFHTATLLMDGRVLIAGGYTSYPVSANSDSAELYIPSRLVPAQIVTALRFDPTSVVVGSSFSANFSGPNLTPETFFDVRFTSPESNESAVVLNWQRGLEVSHDVSAGIVAGSYTIIGVRAHEVETDHTGTFFPVSATITVSSPLSPQTFVESNAAPR
jgi:hypothetical protein